MTDTTSIALDGDFKGHPFRGSQYRTASGESRSAVSSSKKAKHAEKHGDPKAQKKAHKVAHHAHMAASEEATTPAARKYHKIMAKFHASRAGVKLDSVVFDDASDFVDAFVGRIMKDGKQVGRAVIGGDGKAMVFVGDSDDERVKFKSSVDGQMRDAMWSDEDAPRMVEWLLSLVKPPEEAPDERAGAQDQSPGSAPKNIQPEGGDMTYEGQKSRVDEILGGAYTGMPYEDLILVLYRTERDLKRKLSAEDKDIYLAAIEAHATASVMVYTPEMYGASPEALARENDMERAHEDGMAMPKPANDPKAEDRAFLMSVIDGSNPDILEPELADQIQAAFERHSEDAEMISLFTQAVNAYTQAMMNATAGM